MKPNQFRWKSPRLDLFHRLVLILAALAVACTAALDYINHKKGEPSFIFVGAGAGGRVRAEQPLLRDVVLGALEAAGIGRDAVSVSSERAGFTRLRAEAAAAGLQGLADAFESSLRGLGIEHTPRAVSQSGGFRTMSWEIARGGKETVAVELSAAVEAKAPPAKAAAKAAAPKAKEPEPPKPPKGRVALVMDDMGESLEALDVLLALKHPVTVAVIPGTPLAVETARRAHERGLEVILHLPLESLNNHDASGGSDGLLTTGMTAEQIEAGFEEALAGVPFAVGVNNHMGSRFTTEPDAMRLLLGAVKRAGLFFLDSRTTAQSVAYVEARKLRVPAAERDVFLDADEDRGRIRGRLIELFNTARQRGSAVGICHPFPETLEVLRTSFGGLEAYGLEAVPLSRLVN